MFWLIYRDRINLLLVTITFGAFELYDQTSNKNFISSKIKLRSNMKQQPLEAGRGEGGGERRGGGGGRRVGGGGRRVCGRKGCREG